MKMYNAAALQAAELVRRGWASYDEYEAIQSSADSAASRLSCLIENLPETEEEKND